MTDFNQRINRIGSGAIKWDSQSNSYGKEGLLPFWIADGDFLVPEEVIMGLKARVEQGIFGYDCPKEEYFEAIIQWFQKRHGLTLTREMILPTAGIVPSLAFAIEAFSDVGDKVLVQAPVYNPFFDIIERNNRELVINNLRLVENKFEIDFVDLEEKLKTGVKIMIFCSPHNPVGRVWSKDEVEQVARLCRQYHVFLLSDEIHCDLILHNYRHHSMAGIDEIQDLVMICTAPSKTFNIAGLQTSNLIFPNKENKRKFEEVIAAKHWGEPNALGIVAGTVAYQKGEQWLEELLEYIQENIELTKEFFAAHLPKVKVIETEGTYLMWLDFSALGYSTKELEEKLVEVGIALGRGSVYRGAYTGFMRLNVACPKSMLLEGLNLLKEFYQR